MPHFARIFQSGNSQAVRLPKEFRLNADRVEIMREGDTLILRPCIEDDEPWSSLKAALVRGMSDDFLENGREQPENQERPDLAMVF